MLKAIVDRQSEKKKNMGTPGRRRLTSKKTTSYKWAQLGSNQRPISYEPTALTTELWALAERIVSYLPALGKRVIPNLF
jgi:hypothetical protein